MYVSSGLHTSALWPSNRIHYWQKLIATLGTCTRSEDSYKKLWRITVMLYD